MVYGHKASSCDPLTLVIIRVLNVNNVCFNFNFLNSKLHCYLYILHDKCIQLSTNKPSIGQLTHEIAQKSGGSMLNFDISTENSKANKLYI